MPTILVIEDTLAVRESLVEILRLAGYNTIVAGDGKDGLQIAVNKHPDLIICDLSLSIMDGYFVLYMLSKDEACCNIPFILLTARTDRSDIRLAMNLGANDYITKPFTPSELFNSIECQLRKVEHYRPARQQGVENVMSEILIPASGEEDVLQAFVKDRNIRHIKKKQIIYHEGNYPSCLYFILKGKVKIFIIDEDGRELITELCREGDFLGYAALLEKIRYVDTAEAIGEVDLAMIPNIDFEQMLFNDNSLRQQIIRLMAESIEEKEAQLLRTAYDSLRKRTADALLKVFDKYNIADYANVGIKFSRGNFAALVGVAKESLARTLADFRDEHLIDLRKGTIYILDMSKLLQLRK